MRSERPKPLHLLCGRPMVLHVLDALAELERRPGRRGRRATAPSGSPRSSPTEAPRASRSSSSSSTCSAAPATPSASGSPRSPTTTRRRRRRRPRPARATRRCCARRRSPRWSRAPPLDRRRLHGAHRRRSTTRPATAGSCGPTTSGSRGSSRSADATDDERPIDEVNTSIYCFRRGAAGPGAAPAQPDERAGRVLPDRRRRASCHDAGYSVAGRGGRRPGRDRRASTTGSSWPRPRPSCAADQRAVDAARRDDVGPRAHLHRRHRRARRPTSRCSRARCCRARCVVGPGAEIGPDTRSSTAWSGRGRELEHRCASGARDRRATPRSARSPCSAPAAACRRRARRARSTLGAS